MLKKILPLFLLPSLVFGADCTTEVSGLVDLVTGACVNPVTEAELAGGYVTNPMTTNLDGGGFSAYNLVSLFGRPSDKTIVISGDYNSVGTTRLEANGGLVEIGDNISGILKVNTDDFVVTNTGNVQLSSLTAGGYVTAAASTGLLGISSDTLVTNPMTADLDVGGYSFISLSDGDITLAPDGTGVVVFTGGALESSVADGATADAFTLDTENAFTTDGGKLLRINNQGTDKFSFTNIGGFTANNRPTKNSSSSVAGYFSTLLEITADGTASFYGQRNQVTNNTNYDYTKLVGVSNEVVNYGDNDSSQLIGTQSYATSSGAGTTTEAIASLYGLSIQGGIIPNAYGIYIDENITGSGADITNLYGAYIKTVNLSGNVDNYYGLYLTGGGNGLVGNYGIYAPSSASEHYLLGDLGIGAVSEGNAPLEVNGPSGPQLRLIQGAGAYTDLSTDFFGLLTIAPSDFVGSGLATTAIALKSPAASLDTGKVVSALHGTDEVFAAFNGGTIQFPAYTTNGILTTTGGDGTLAVSTSYPTGSGNDTEIAYWSGGALAGDGTFVWDGDKLGVGTYSPSTYGGDLVVASASNPQLTVAENSVGAFINLEQRSNIAYLTRDDGDILAFGVKSTSDSASITPQLTLSSFGNLALSTAGATVSGSSLNVQSTAGSLDLISGASNDIWFKPAGVTQFIFYDTGEFWTSAGTFLSNVADGATAVAFDLDTANTLATSGADLFRVSNNGTTRLSIDYDGFTRVAGTTSQFTINPNGTASGDKLAGVTISPFDSGGPNDSHLIISSSGSSSAIGSTVQAASFENAGDGWVSIWEYTSKAAANGPINFEVQPDGHGNMSVGHSSPDSRLDVNGAITERELSADPADPDEGSKVCWMSDGTGSGDDGDYMCKITAGGTTKTATLIDFSAI